MEFFPMPRKLNAAVHPERCSGALAYCNQRYINSMKLVRQRLEIGEASQEADAAQEEEILNE